MLRLSSRVVEKIALKAAFLHFESREHDSGYLLDVSCKFMLLPGKLLLQKGAEGTVGPECFARRSGVIHSGP